MAIAFGFALVAWINTVIINLISLWVEGHDIGNVWSATNDLFISPQRTEVIRTADIVVVVLPAFVANIWAVLFLVSGLTARLFFVLFPAIRWTQWFVRGGESHPLRVIGIVAAGISFITTLVVNMIF